MSEQTDQLFHIHETTQEEINERQSRYIEQQLAIQEANKKIRLLNDLLANPAFRFYQEQLRVEQQAAFSHMEKADNAHIAAVAQGAYCALTRTIHWPQEELQQTLAFIKGLEKK